MAEMMRTSSDIHIPADAEVETHIRSLGSGERYIVLTIRGSGGQVNLYFWEGAEVVLDKIENECVRAVREFVGDVPAPSQGYLDGLGELQSREALR